MLAPRGGTAVLAACPTQTVMVSVLLGTIVKRVPPRPGSLLVELTQLCTVLLAGQNIFITNSVLDQC